MSDSRERPRTGSMLIVGEIAFSMLLVAGALNMTSRFIRLMRTDPGVQPEERIGHQRVALPK